MRDGFEKRAENLVGALLGKEMTEIPSLSRLDNQSDTIISSVIQTVEVIQGPTPAGRVRVRTVWTPLLLPDGKPCPAPPPLSPHFPSVLSSL